MGAARSCAGPLDEVRCHPHGGDVGRRPVEKLSSMRTRCAAASNSSTTCEPMKPAPPVTDSLAQVLQRTVRARSVAIVLSARRSSRSFVTAGLRTSRRNAIHQVALPASNPAAGIATGSPGGEAVEGRRRCRHQADAQWNAAPWRRATSPARSPCSSSASATGYQYACSSPADRPLMQELPYAPPRRNRGCGSGRRASSIIDHAALRRCPGFGGGAVRVRWSRLDVDQLVFAGADGHGHGACPDFVPRRRRSTSASLRPAPGRTSSTWSTSSFTPYLSSNRPIKQQLDGGTRWLRHSAFPVVERVTGLVELAAHVVRRLDRSAAVLDFLGVRCALCTLFRRSTRCTALAALARPAACLASSLSESISTR